MSRILHAASLHILIGCGRRCRAVHALIHGERGLGAGQVLDLAGTRVFVLHHGHVGEVNLTVVRDLELPVERVTGLVGRLINGLNDADVRVALLLVGLRLRLRRGDRLRRVTLHPLATRITPLGVSRVLHLVGIHILRGCDRGSRAHHGLANTERRTWARHVRQRASARVLVLNDLHVIQDGFTIVRDLEVPVERVTLSVFRLTNRLNNADVRGLRLHGDRTVPLFRLAALRPRVDDLTVTVRVTVPTEVGAIFRSEPAMNATLSVGSNTIESRYSARRPCGVICLRKTRVIPVNRRIACRWAILLSDSDTTQTLNIVEHDVNLTCRVSLHLPLQVVNIIASINSDNRRAGPRHIRGLAASSNRVGDVRVKTLHVQVAVSDTLTIAFP